MMKGEEDTGRFVVSKDTKVADVLKHVPGSLELLISYGFTPLTDPAIRQAVTPHVTLETGSRVHRIDLDALLRDLNRLAEGAAGQISQQPVEATLASPSPIGLAQVDAGQVLVALRNCYDPEVPYNIVDLGLVYNVRVDSGCVVVRMTLTSPDCSSAGQVVAQVAEAIREIGVSEVEVELVREPPWNPSRMAPAARYALGLEV